MASRGKKEKEIDPEELMRKKFRAKCLFRALGRLAMANTYWLIEAVDEYEGVEDVQRRVQQAVRGKTKKKQLLNVMDKALLNKPADERTDQEKKYIYKIIGGLKCFKRYPNHVKRKLAAATYFKYYSPGRVIVRQHQEAHALYFIVTGDVIVSQMVFDELLQVYVSVDVGTMHAGDMFGEVSLLHNIPRTATCTTAGHCELLALLKEDFKNVLQASIQAQWDIVCQAMSAFTYFDSLDEVARREGCIVAKMKSYQVNETLLGDGNGIANFVYFILSGQCQMVETLQVSTVRRLGKNYYTLFDPYIPVEESEQDIDEKYFAAYKNVLKSGESQSSQAPAGSSENVPHMSILKKRGSSRPSTVKSTEKRELSNVTVKMNELDTEPDDVPTLRRASSAKSHVLIMPPMGPDTMRESFRVSLQTETVTKNLKTYFVQVCKFNPGSTFGFGENMRDRRIVALTPVDCLLFPKVWLLQRNTANIWTRIQHYLEKKIPTKKQIFKEFVKLRQWADFKELMVEDVVARSNTVNWTSIHDVPYTIRMEEMLDI